MRIAVWHNLPSGGGQRALFDHVRGLVRRGHELEIWAPPTADNSLLDFRTVVPYHQVDLSGAQRFYYLPYGSDLGVRADIKAMDHHCAQVAQEISRKPFDVLLSGSCARFGAPRIARSVGLPSVLYLQEPLRRLYESPSVWALRRTDRSLPGLVRVAYDMLRVQSLRLQVREETANAKAFRTILVNSWFSAESVARAYGLPSRVCYLGVDPAIWDVGPRAPERLAVGIGEFSPHKGIDFVLRALALTDRPHPELHWVGNRADPDYLQQLCTQAEKLHVAFTPHVAVPQAELTALLRRAAFLVYAPHLEPFGYAPLECAAAGIPTIAVAEGGIRETVEDRVTGLLVAREVDAMAAAINRLIGDGEQTALLGKAAQHGAYSRWAIEDAITRLETELQRTLAASVTAS